MQDYEKATERVLELNGVRVNQYFAVCGFDGGATYVLTSLFW
jgi:hypothetical protein